MQIEDIQPQQTKFLTKLQKQGKSPNSLKSYRLDFECFNRFIEQKVKGRKLLLNQFVVDDFEFFLEELYPSVNSRRRKLQTLRLFFDYLVEKRFYPENPIKKIASAPKSLLPPMPTKFPDIFRAIQELKKQLQSPQSDFEETVALRNAMILILIYEAGISVAPLSKLKTNDVIIGSSSLRIVIQSVKRDPYSIPIATEHITLIKRYLQRKPDFEELFFYANNFKIVRGGISARGIEDIFQKTSKQLGISLTPKSLRQSAILKWILEEKPASSIKEWLGVAPSYSLALYNKYIQDQKDLKEDQLDYQSLTVI